MINFNFSKKGLTLIEIIVVVAILMVVLGVGLASFRALSSQIELNGSTKNLIENLRYAQQLSVTEQMEYGIIFSTTTEQKYELVKHQDGSTTTIKEISLPSEVYFKSITPLDNNEIRFNSYGAVKESGDVILENEKEQTITIRIRPSGFIKQID